MNKTKNILRKLGFEAPARPARALSGDELVDLFLSHIRRLKPADSEQSPMRQFKRDTGQLDDLVKHKKKTWVDHALDDLNRYYEVDHNGDGVVGFTPKLDLNE